MTYHWVKPHDSEAAEQERILEWLEPWPCLECGGVGCDDCFHSGCRRVVIDPRTPAERDADEHDAEVKATHESVRP